MDLLLPQDSGSRQGSSETGEWFGVQQSMTGGETCRTGTFRYDSETVDALPSGITNLERLS